MMCGQMSCLYFSNEIRILFIRARPLFICMVLSTENTVIFVSLFLPGIMQHISKRKTKKFVMQTQRFLIWESVKSRQAAVIWLKYMTRKDVFVIWLKIERNMKFSYIRQQSRNICPQRKRIFQDWLNMRLNLE